MQEVLLVAGNDDLGADLDRSGQHVAVVRVGRAPPVEVVAALVLPQVPEPDAPVSELITVQSSRMDSWVKHDCINPDLPSPTAQRGCRQPPDQTETDADGPLARERA